MSEEQRLDEAAERDEVFANEVTPLGVTKEDQSGPRAEHEAAISGSYAPGPGSGPEGTGADLGAYPGGSHARGEGPNQPDNPVAGGARTTTRPNTPQQPAGKMTHKSHAAEDEAARGPKTSGDPQAYQADDQGTPYQHTHEGNLSLAGGSSGSGGGGEEILDSIQGEQDLDETQRARPPRPYPSSAEPVPDEMSPGQPEPGEPLVPGGKDSIEEPEAKTPGA